MNLIVCKDEDEASQRAHEWCEVQIRQTGARSLFVPAGRTPERLYRLWETQRPSFLGSMDILQIDDVLTSDQAGVFRRYFETHLPSYRSQLVPIEDAERGADLAVLGLGLNGHVAFHEPGLPDDFFSGCVRLTAPTCHTLGLSSPQWGISYGLAAFLQARAVLLLVTGAGKRDILDRVLHGEKGLPASGLLRHPALTVIADQAAVVVP